MDFKQFNTFLEYSEVRAFDDNGQTKVGFLPIHGYDETKVYALVNELLESGEEYPFTMEKFQEYADKYTPLRNAQINAAFNVLKTSGLEDIAKKTPEKRLSILEKIMPSMPKLADIEKLRPYKEKIAQLMFDLKFSKQFWKKEEELALKFVNRLRTIPDLKEKIAGWQNLEISEQKECLEKIADVFCKTYQIKPIKINFFTLDEYRENQIKQGLEPSKVPPTGLANIERREISFCQERMKICDNYVPIYLTFHEALHISQHERDFSPMEERMFNSKFQYFQLVTNDAYLLSPEEMHAYAMDALVKQKAQESLRVPFIDNKYDDKTQKTVKQANATVTVLHAYNVR